MTTWEFIKGMLIVWGVPMFLVWYITWRFFPRREHATGFRVEEAQTIVITSKDHKEVRFQNKLFWIVINDDAKLKAGDIIFNIEENRWENCPDELVGKKGPEHTVVSRKISAFVRTDKSMSGLYMGTVECTRCRTVWEALCYDESPTLECPGCGTMCNNPVFNKERYT